MPILRRDSGPERQMENTNGSECQNQEVMATLNAEIEKWWRLWTPRLRRNSGFERQSWEVMMALNSKLISGDGSECQTENVSVGSECQTRIEALNAKWKIW